MFFLSSAEHFRFFLYVSLYTVPRFGGIVGTCSSGVGPNMYDLMVCMMEDARRYQARRDVGRCYESERKPPIESKREAVQHNVRSFKLFGDGGNSVA